MDKDSIFHECELILKCIEEKSMPTLYITPSASTTKSEVSQSNNIVKADKEEIERLVKDFQIAFLLPGGQNLTMDVCSTQSIQSVMMELCKIGLNNFNALLLHYSAYDFRIYRKDDIITVNSSIQIGEVPYIVQCRQTCTIPKLELIQKNHNPFTEQEKKISVDVTSLVGRPIALSEKQEGQNFRVTMARLRYLERKSKWEQQPNQRKRLRLSVHLANTKQVTATEGKIMASVTLPLIKFKKTILLQETETVDECLKKMYAKYYQKTHPEKSVEDFVFKVAGVREFFCGPHPFSSFQFIQKKLAKQEKIELVMCERVDFELKEIHNIEEEFDAEWLQGGEEVCINIIIIYYFLIIMELIYFYFY